MPPSAPTRLFPVFYRDWPEIRGRFFLDSLAEVYPQARFGVRTDLERVKLSGLDEISGRKRQRALLRIYAPLHRRVNAAEWCSVVDCVEKLSKISSAAREPYRSLRLILQQPATTG
jgi:hypothetical protein